MHLWYADDSSVIGTLYDLKHFYNKLKRLGYVYGYYPNPLKTKLVTTPGNLRKAEEVFGEEGFEIVTGSRYLGAYIGDR